MGLQRIANRVNSLARLFAECSSRLGFQVRGSEFFDTVVLKDSENLKAFLSQKQINTRSLNKDIAFSFDETHTLADVQDLVTALTEFKGGKSTIDLV